MFKKKLPTKLLWNICTFYSLFLYVSTLMLYNSFLWQKSIEKNTLSWHMDAYTPKDCGIFVFVAVILLRLQILNLVFCLFVILYHVVRCKILIFHFQWSWKPASHTSSCIRHRILNLRFVLKCRLSRHAFFLRPFDNTPHMFIVTVCFIQTNLHNILHRLNIALD